MPFVGNDVVDLKDASNAGRSEDSRFLKKILTDAEIEYIKIADNPDRALWSFWACKETAYKIAKKYLHAVAFVPRRWNVVLKTNRSGNAEGKVDLLGKEEIHVRLFSDPDYIHCVGTDNLKLLNKLIWRVEALPEKEKINPSLFLRHCVTHDLAKNLSLNADQIKIKRTRQDGELQYPQVYIDEKRANIDLSLSHDGRFVAYAYSQIRSAAERESE